MELLNSRIPGLSLAFIVESALRAKAGPAIWDAWMQLRLPLLAPDFHEREIFCCGRNPICVPCATCPTSRFRHGLLSSGKHFGAPPVEPYPAFRRGADGNRRAGGFQFRRLCRCTSSLSEVDGDTQPDRPAGGTRQRFSLPAVRSVRHRRGEEDFRPEVEMNHNGGILDDEIAERLYPRLLFQTAGRAGNRSLTTLKKPDR